jgi:hypothetical protein
MQSLRIINLGVRFLLELASLAAFAYWGWTLRASIALRVAAAIALPLLVGIFWGVFVAPRARIPTGRVGQSGLGLVVFLLAAAALYSRGHSVAALVFALVALVSSLVLYALPQ